MFIRILVTKMKFALISENIMIYQKCYALLKGEKS